MKRPNQNLIVFTAGGIVVDCFLHDAEARQLAALLMKALDADGDTLTRRDWRGVPARGSLPRSVQCAGSLDRRAPGSHFRGELLRALLCLLALAGWAVVAMLVIE